MRQVYIMPRRRVFCCSSLLMDLSSERNLHVTVHLISLVFASSKRKCIYLLHMHIHVSKETVHANV